MRTIGLIGGTSYHSTIDYYRMINEKVGERIGTDKNPTLLLYSLNIEIMRSRDQDRIKEEYLAISNKLIDMGAEGIIICANTPHLVYDFVQPKIKVPILHIAQAIGEYSVQKKFTTLGLLGTKPTAQLGFIATYLKREYSIDTVLPSEGNIDQVHHYISKELTQGNFTDEAKKYFLEQMDFLSEKGADAMILGCTELPLLIKKEMTNHELIDTTKLHVELAVNFILNE